MKKSERILVIDDDESVRKVLSTALEMKGYVVDTAQKGEEAAEKTREQSYDLALIDIRLPDMEGTKLLAAMKETTPRMMKIIVTGYPSLQNAIEAVNKGADGYVVKPLDMEKLLKTIEEHLKKHREELKYSEEKVTEFIETRAREVEPTRARK
jgi:DNA-binding NtrC family response regulator